MTAFFAAFVYLFAYISGFAHDLESRHVECPEHGHMIHLDHLDGHDDDHHGVDEDDEEPPAVAAIPTNDHSDHDHCGLTVVTNSPRILVDHADLSGIITWVDGATDETFVPSTPIRGPTVAIIALAPKTSPPQLA